jgi:hypothetical protein
VQHVAVVVVQPRDAKVVRSGTSENLNVAAGKEPIAVDVVGGAPVELDVTAPGQKPLHVTLDGSVNPFIVSLDPAPSTSKTKPNKPPPPPANGKKCDPLLDPKCDLW